MNLPDILNVALGVIVLYLLLSSIASLVIDLVTGAAHYREEILYVTINRLLAGEPDQPWNISKLVFDRIGQRLADDGLQGWLRRRWVQPHTVEAPPPELIQRFLNHPKIRALAARGGKPGRPLTERIFAEVVLAVTQAGENKTGSLNRQIALLRDLALPANSAPAAVTPNAATTDSALVEQFRAHPKILGLTVPDAGTLAEVVLSLTKSTAPGSETAPSNPVHALLHALAATTASDTSAQNPAEKNPDVVQRFWRHPKIRSLAVPGADSPPAMEASTFAAVVIDIAVPRDAQALLPDNRLVLLRALDAPNDETPAALLKTLRTLGLSSEIPVGATGDALWNPFRANIASWFNEASARASDVYRRSMQRLLLGLGFALALVLNADTIRTIHLLSNDRPLREAMGAYSQTLVAEHNARIDAATPAGKTAAAAMAPVNELTATRVALSDDITHLKQIEQIGFPIGWNAPDNGFHDADALFHWAARFTSGYGILLATATAVFLMIFFKLIGLGATALAVSQGAPFWYDLMNRLIGLRKGQASAPNASDPAAPLKPTVVGGGASAGASVPASALPLEIGHDLAAPATGFNARKAYWLARASAAAYSPQREIEALVKQSWKFHECHFFDHEGTQGFCASDDQIVLIAFRGTELSETNDILADVNIKMVPLADYGNQPVCNVHEGFEKGLGQVWTDLSEKILAWTAPQPGRAARQIFITGHSLGGALATLMFARLAIAADRPVPTLYNFGCPKVGDGSFAHQLDRRYPERLFRLINDTDIVPQLPPLPAYFHAGREFVFDVDGKLRSEISGLGRLLGYAANAAKSIKDASRKAIDDHGVAYYVARCETLAKIA